jgi:glycosyltransferase involved in cell wall biosynthesis
MKIVLLADSFLLDPSTGVNGTQVQLYNLAQGFERRGMDVYFIASTGKWEKDCEIISGIKLHWIKPRNGVFSWVYYIRAYFSVLDRIQPDVVYQRGRSYLTYVAGKWSRRNGKKFVWASNGEDGCDFRKNIKRLMKSRSPLWKKMLLSPNALLQDILIHKGIRGTESVVNQTENQKEKLRRNFQKNGVVVPSYFPVPAEESGPLKKEKIVLWLANLSPWKQPEVFLKLAGHCHDCKGWKFILAGGTKKGSYFQKISEQAKVLPNLKIAGPIPFEESNKFFSKASLFVNTSIMEAEGIPNTFIQAWLSSTPVLSLVHDPNGWIKRHSLGFCAEGNLKSFFETGKALIKNESALVTMGEDGRKFALNMFATEKIIDTYVELFRATSYGS